MTGRRSESYRLPRRVALAMLGGASIIAGCGDPTPRPRPVEIPIGEYRVEGPGPAGETPASKGATKTRETTTSGAATADAGGSVASVPEEPRAADGPPSRELDVKGGFLGASFGSTPKAFRGLVLLDNKKPEVATYRAPDKSYGGFALRDLLFVFRKGKLATIQFAVKNAADCKPFREVLVRELGPPQRASGESATWRGEKVALRFVTGSTGTCAGAVQSKELARSEWESL